MMTCVGPLPTRFVSPVSRDASMWQNAFLVDDFIGSPLLSGLMRDSSAAREKLGPPADWPNALQSAARLLLAARYPALVCWGSELTLLYNDAAIPLLGQRHPAAADADQPQVLHPAVALHDLGACAAPDGTTCPATNCAGMFAVLGTSGCELDVDDSQGSACGQ